MIKHYHDELPDLVTRERMPNKIEVECPKCGRWRPSFCIVEVDGIWQCDADTTKEARGGN